MIQDISTIVKDKANPIAIIRDILMDQNGILLSSDLVKVGIPRTYLSNLEKTEKVQRVSRGMNSVNGKIVDKFTSLQVRYGSTIFSHQTAFYPLDLTDRTPLSFTQTTALSFIG